MRYICTREQMKAIDRISMEQIGIPSSVLMERAAMAVFREIQARFPEGTRCLVLVGQGNNGGDGLALSRILSEQGYPVQVLLIGEHKRSEECDRQLNIIRQMWLLSDSAYRQDMYEPLMHHRTRTEKKYKAGRELSVSQILSNADTKAFEDKKFDIIIDCIFGIGLSREVISPESDVIRMANQMEGFKIAVDIPSGLDANTGQVLGTVFEADLTVTFGYGKLGMFMGDGPIHIGTPVVVDIGFLKAAEGQTAPSIYTMGTEILKDLPARIVNSNKGTYGRVAVIAGSENMAGAAYFAAAAAYRSGVGLVKVYTHSSHRSMLFTKLPEALFEAYDDKPAAEVVASAAEFADVLVVGPGLGQSEFARQLVHEALSQNQCPVVLDADGLNIVANHREWISECRTQLVMTPHLKEIERLTDINIGQIAHEALKVADEFARQYGVVCVLKGAHTIVTAEGNLSYINTTGNHGMSTGGTGDLLAGMIGALAAGMIKTPVQRELTDGQQEDEIKDILYDAACLGVFLHGMAGDKAAEKSGARAMLASDVLDGLCTVLNEASPA